MSPRLVLLAGWLVFMLYAYPGHMTFVALEQLTEVRFDRVSDLYGPLMCRLWSLTEILIAGPAGMLVVQSALVLFGVNALLRRRLAARPAAIASALLLVFPPVMAAVAVIDAHVMLAGMLLCTAALFGHERRAYRVAGLVLVAIACGLREGAALAAAPIVIAGFLWRAEDRGVRRYGIAVGAWICAALLGYAIEHVSTEHVTRQPEVERAAFEIAGILAHTSELSDAHVRELAAGDIFTPGGDLQARARAAPAKLFVQPRTDAEVETLLAARSRVRAHDRGAYLAMQWVHWKRLVGLTGRSISRVYAKDGETREHRLVLAHTARPSPVQKLLVRFARAVARTFAFAPILYFVIALVLVPFARRDRVALMLLASGIVLQLALAFVTWHEEYRFSTWPILATLVALVLVVSGRRAASASPG